MNDQEWEDADFCIQYERTWEISLSEVHYGWLSPGENALQLLKGEVTQNCNVLDVGCGLGQNLVALANQGAIGYGLDISDCMLKIASKIVSDAKLNTKITLQQGDMRAFSAFSAIEFDIVLSVYSMEYLKGTQELKTVIHNLYKRLKPGGVFIMCFSHPSQVTRYPQLMNESVPQGVGKYKMYNYSIRDATQALFKAGFSVERILEQSTNNPSLLSYEEAKQYPYHFREGCSPFLKRYDNISNHAPHTIIYKARRQKDPATGLAKQRKLGIGLRKLWGYERKVIRYRTISHLGLFFEAIHLAPMDNVLGLLDVLSFRVQPSDIISPASEIEIHTTKDSIHIPENSIFGLIHRKLNALALGQIYQIYSVNSEKNGPIENRILIESIPGLDYEISLEFNSTKLGLLIFVNGHEPSMGELPLDVIEAKSGDQIEIVYVAFKDDISKKNLNQLGLFQ